MRARPANPADRTCRPHQPLHLPLPRHPHPPAGPALHLPGTLVECHPLLAGAVRQLRSAVMLASSVTETFALRDAVV